MVVRERMHDESGGYEWGEVFRYDRMGRLTKMWYGVRNPGGFASTDPEEGTHPYDHRKIWTLGPVYERQSVKQKPYQQAEGTTAYTVNDHYQVTAGPAAMTWNDNGYLTGRGADDFAWTALGQLAQADLDGGDTLEYTYDAFGRRVKTVNGSQVNRFLYHGWHMVGEYDDVADAWLWQEAPWNSSERMLEHVALDTNDLDGDQNVNEYRQYAVHEDFQDTVWGLSGTDAAIAERYNYTDPYWQSDSEDGSANALGDFATQVFHRKRMHGGFIEAESELYDFRNRWLVATVGDWISQDPIPRSATGFLNDYQFVLCSPALNVDWNGLSAICPNGDDCFRRPGEECPAKSCFERIQNGWQPKFWESPTLHSFLETIKKTPSNMVNCDCSRCVKPGGGFAAGATLLNRDNRIIIRYTRTAASDWESEGGQAASSLGFPPPPHLIDDPEKCCPCGPVEDVLLHEFAHKWCRELGLNCGNHPGGKYEPTGATLAECLASKDVNSPQCGSAERALEKEMTKND